MIYTIGHSNRSIEAFIEVLKSFAVTTLVDVRAYPRSRHYPWFCQDDLREALYPENIFYHWAGRHLGGMRTPRPQSVHVALEEDGFRAYADHMQTSEFQVAARQLINLSQKAVLAFMCAERRPEECHRHFLSDYLLLQGCEVEHIIETGTSYAHQLNVNARRESSELIYDRMSSGELNFGDQSD